MSSRKNRAKPYGLSFLAMKKHSSVDYRHNVVYNIIILVNR